MDDSAIRVLLIEDGPEDSGEIVSYLPRCREVRIELERANCLSDGLKCLETGRIDVVLLDLDLPESRGLETLRRVHAHSPDVPLIVMTGTDVMDLALSAVREGASDYLFKGQLDAQVLIRAIRYSVERSRRRRAEHTLEETQALYHSLVESLPLNVFQKNLRGEIVFGNRRYCETLGLGLEDLVGKTDGDLFPRHLVVKYRQDDQRVIDTGEIVEDVEEHRRPDGQIIHVHVLKAPVRDARGQIIGVQGMFWDVTARHLAGEALREAKEAAEEASRAKSAFLANMTHEIRTPLIAILGMTQLVLDSRLNSEQRDLLTTALESGEALLAIVDDILDFSRIENGNLTVETAPFELRKSLSDPLKWLTGRARAQGLELICRIDDDVPETVVGDSARLRQVVVNLVGNAIKFTDVGKVAVHVERESSAHDSVVLRFSVSDTGIGIPEEKRAAVFEAFEQADTTLARRFGGLGLGLTISSRLVRLMGGRIWVESQIGRGSTFHFTIRFSGPSPADNPPPLQPVRPARRLRILLAEDSLVNQKLAVGLLEKQGHEVTVAANGREAIAALEEGEFDLVLMDVQMPEMDGLEAAAAIRAREKGTGRHIPMIAMTAHSLQGDRERCLEVGMDDYVSKPIRSQRLYETIESALGRTPLEAAAPAAGASPKGEVDWEQAFRSVKGDTALLDVMVQAVLEECPRLMAEIDRAAVVRDGTALRFAAHKLKGAVRYFGAAGAFENAFRLEKMGRDADFGQAEEVLAVLRPQVAAVTAALAEYRRTR